MYEFKFLLKFKFIHFFVQLSFRKRFLYPLTEALLGLTNQELLFKHSKKIDRALVKARFPKIKRMVDFEFGYQPSINKKYVLDFQHLSFLDKQENILFIGSP